MSDLGPHTITVKVVSVVLFSKHFQFHFVVRLGNSCVCLSGFLLHLEVSLKVATAY